MTRIREKLLNNMDEQKKGESLFSELPVLINMEITTTAKNLP